MYLHQLPTDATLPDGTPVVGVVDDVLTVVDIGGGVLKVQPAAPSASFVDPLTTKGDLMVRTATTTTRKAAGSNGYALVYDSTKTDGLDAKPVVQTVVSTDGTVSINATDPANLDVSATGVGGVPGASVAGNEYLFNNAI